MYIYVGYSLNTIDNIKIHCKSQEWRKNSSAEHRYGEEKRYVLWQGFKKIVSGIFQKRVSQNFCISCSGLCTIRYSIQLIVLHHKHLVAAGSEREKGNQWSSNTQVWLSRTEVQICMYSNIWLIFSLVRYWIRRFFLLNLRWIVKTYCLKRWMYGIVTFALYNLINTYLLDTNYTILRKSNIMSAWNFN